MASTLPVSISQRLAATAAYSYRQDPTVPSFDDSKPLVIYDGVCVFCSHAMRSIARRDRSGLIQFASAQSPLGQALFRHYGLDPITFETVLLLRDGHAFGKFAMALEMAHLIGGPWRLSTVFRPLPRRLQDLAYDLVAKNRYRLFGRTDTCMLPDPSWRSRVIDHPVD
jgi:predicted DCC family thiol-disulfide oxidoreductase YuxK